MADGGQTRDYDAYLAQVGQRVRSARARQRVSRRELSERSDVSERYLAQLEGGNGNITILLLKRIADALAMPMSVLVDDAEKGPLARLVSGYLEAPTNLQAQAVRLLDPENDGGLKGKRVALIGLRGAGKSTLGKAVSSAIGVKFVELNTLISESSGMPVAEIIALYGQEGYRRLEKRALEAVANSDEPLVLAVAGGIVSDPTTFEFLLCRFNTIWLRASPREHMERVQAQGDMRPMEGNPTAMAELRGILQAREALYTRADEVIDTSNNSVESSALDVMNCMKGRFKIVA